MPEVIAAGTSGAGAAPGEDEWTVAGGGPVAVDGRLRNPVDVAVAPDGSVYVTDQTANAVLRYTPRG